MSEDHDGTSQRVTNALLGQKIDTVIETVERVERDGKEWKLDHEKRIRCLETNQTEIKTNMSNQGRNLTIMQVIGSTISAAFGALVGPR